ncbi:MAG: hypothetical protein KC468_05900 [Myxococcales bacterium]|nr:hypothetical protein [Myxococcales bacterium]
MLAGAAFSYRPVRIPTPLASPRAPRPRATPQTGARTERVRVGALERARREALVGDMYRLFTRTCTGFSRPEFERLFLTRGDVEFELTYDRRGELSGFSVVQERARL